MMIVRIIGAIDFVVGLVFWLFGFLQYYNINVFPTEILAVLGTILLIKGIIFAIGLDIMSFLDIICGVIIIVAATTVLPTWIIYIVSIFLLQKGFFSLLG